MKVVKRGHKYKLENMEGGTFTNLHFIEKKLADESSVDLITVTNGTTNEEVLKVLIDRMGYLQEKMPCRENAIVITKLEESLMWLEKRTQDRMSRQVENKFIH